MMLQIVLDHLFSYLPYRGTKVARAQMSRPPPVTASSDAEILRTIYTPSTLIFTAEADRLEAGGFNLVIDIKTSQGREHHEY